VEAACGAREREIAGWARVREEEEDEEDEQEEVKMGRGGEDGKRR